MPRTSIVYVGLALAFVVAGCGGGGPEPLPDRPVDENFYWSVTTWTSGSTLAFSHAAFEHDGAVAVCGLRSSTADTPAERRFDALALPQMRLTLAGTPILGDLSRLPEAAPNGDRGPQGVAECYVTDVPWRAQYEGVPAEVKSSETEFQITG